MATMGGWWAELTDSEVRSTSSQLLVLVVTLYNLLVMVFRVLEVDIGRVDDLNTLADMVLYLDSALGIFSLLVAVDGVRSLDDVRELLNRDGAVFTLQVAASLDTRYIAEWLEASHAHASLFRYTRAVRLLTIPSLAVDLRDGMFYDLGPLWVPSTVLATIMAGCLYAVDVALQEQQLLPVTPPELIFGVLGLVILTAYVTELVRYRFGSDRIDADIDADVRVGRPAPSRASVLLHSPEHVGITRDLYMDLRIGAVKDVFGLQLASESEGEGGQLVRAIAKQFRAEMMPVNASIDLGSGSKRLYLLVKGSLRGTTPQGKIEMMKAPRTFGGLFEDTDALDDSKVLVSQEPSELYVLDELSIHDLQRVYPALGLSIRSRLQKQAVSRDVADVTSAFKQGLFYATLLSLMMISILALAVRLHESRLLG